ncbi:Uncharacterised protein [Serratia quinivorans]|nr:Uncharacterised protein [Serratia quinivorans]CAI2095946.1 Uncharacterised protein [Serratia quinivorans]
MRLEPIDFLYPKNPYKLPILNEIMNNVTIQFLKEKE